jgi:cell division protein FtsI (penicillin-binding protein 3)
LYVKKQFPEPGSFNEEIVVYLGEWIFKECNIR